MELRLSDPNRDIPPMGIASRCVFSRQKPYMLDPLLATPPTLGTPLTRCLANKPSWVPTKVLRSEGSRNFLWGLELAMHWLRVDQQLTNSLCKILRGLFCTGIQLSGERAKSGLLNVNQGLSKDCQSWTETRSVLELPTPSLPTPFGGSGPRKYQGFVYPFRTPKCLERKVT